ncbi:hypothetical protein [Paenibacillus methanolicus]|uniref:hypothetical protein n=1 Tax=Paenibacillus methanolicus TaxID=582686 RepID=UPI0011E6B053|nr:hypothetical protein [Paenibacillus methanolicus]
MIYANGIFYNLLLGAGAVYSINPPAEQADKRIMQLNVFTPVHPVTQNKNKKTVAKYEGSMIYSNSGRESETEK